MRATGTPNGAGGLPHRVLVTGANGLIGTALCHRLHRRGHRVRALCGPAATATGPPAGIEVANGDILDAGLLAELVAEMDIVVHLAGPSSVSESFQAPVAFARVHVDGTVMLLEACRATQVRRFVYVSSAEIYGRRARQPVHEDAPTDPASPYAAAKLGAEAFVRSFAYHAPVEVAIVRPFLVYGPGQSPRSLVAELVQQVSTGEPVRLRDPRPVRDLVHVRDVAAALEAASFARLVAPARTFNVASGVGISTLALARVLLELAGREPTVAEHEADRPATAQVLELVGDVQRARNELRYRPQLRLEDGLKELLWIERRGAASHASTPVRDGSPGLHR
jgi:nucleoside-diphosphate-sugar epimerase